MKKLSITVLLSLLLAVVLVACSNDEEADDEKDEDKTIAVETAEVKKKDLIVEKAVYGRIAAGSMTPVMLQGPGELDELKVENGDKVKKDDTVAVVLTEAGKQDLKAGKKGVVASLSASEGDMLSDSDPLLVITDMKDVYVEASVTHDVRDLLKVDDKLDAEVDGETYEAKITSIDSVPDDSGLFPIKAKIKNKDDDLLTGMVAQLSVEEKREKKALLVPTEAVIEESDDTYVYIVKGEKAKKVTIEVKESQSDYTAIEGLIEKGDQVVINGQLTLYDEAKVDVIEEEENDS